MKDIKDPSGNYSLPGFRECKQITSHNYTGCVGLAKHITKKIRHVFCDIHHLRWITEVIQGVCIKCFKLATMHNRWIVKMLKIHFIQIWIFNAWLSVYVNRTSGSFCIQNPKYSPSLYWPQYAIDLFNQMIQLLIDLLCLTLVSNKLYTICLQG